MRTILNSILILVFFAISLTAFTFCKKKTANPIKVNGNVIDQSNSKSISNATVKYYASKVSNGIYSSGYEKILETTTDENGSFSCEIPQEKYSGYKVEITAPNYYRYSEEFPTSEFSTDEINTPTYKIHSEATLRLYVENISPFDSNDYISVQINSTDGGGQNCCSGTTIEGSGMNFSQTAYCKTYGDQQLTVTFHVIKSGISEVHSITRYCTAFDTTSANVLY